MKTYSKENNQLPIDVIKSSVQKWQQGKNTTIDNFVQWWNEIGCEACSFCYYFNGLCEKCPLNDYSNSTCSIEWRKMSGLIELLNQEKISKHEAYKQFHKEAVKLYSRISKITPQSLTQWSEDNGK